MPWRVELGSDAARSLRRLRGETRARMDRAIDQLATNPRRPGKAIKAIEGRQDRFLRLCVGDHRIMYEIDDAHQVVLIEGIVARKDFDKWLRSR